MSILTVARMGKFSSDRAIREYAEKIWKLRPLAATVGAASPGARPPGPPYEAV